MLSSHRIRLAIACLVAAWAPLAAQSTFGSFVGTIVDASGAAVPNCVVKAVNRGTSGTRASLTDPSGSFALVNLEPGTYDVLMESPGFQRSNHTNLILTARQTVRVDGRLSVASQTETVNVSAASETIITTEVSNIAETKSGKELQDLPIAIASRASGSTSPISTLTTQAGVQTDNNGNLSIAGAKPAMLSVSIDGISSTSPRNSAPIAELFPSFGAIAEIRVSEVNNAAEFGGVSDITTISKGGTNAFHGGVFENLQNTLLNARNPFSAVRPKTIMNNFGGYAGGPVTIPGLYKGTNKTFFFASYEALRLPREQLIVHSVPSLALREGDLSVYSPRVIRDPSSGLPFPNYRVPASSISPIARNVINNLFPLPNTGATNSIANNYRQNYSTPVSSDQGDIRLDQNISDRQNAFARFTYKFRQVEDAPTGTILAGPTVRPEYNYGITIAHNFLLTPRLANELRGGFNGTRSLAGNNINAVDMINRIGIVGIPNPPAGSGGPNFTIQGFQATSVVASSFSEGDTLQLLDNLTWAGGRHTIKVGGDFRHLTGYFANVFAGSRASTYTYNGSVTNSIINSPYAAFLVGIPDRTGLATVNSPDTFSRSNHWALYAQDDFKLTPRLTVNFGLRWEFHPPFADKFNNVANLLVDRESVVNGVPVNGAVVVPDEGYGLINPAFAAAIAPTPFLKASEVGLNRTLHKAYFASFASRAGFAWRPTADGKTVVRGGYGRYIETLMSALITAGWAVGASNVGLYNQTLVNGQPTLRFPFPFPSNLSQPGTATFEYASDVNYKDPYVHQWNVTVERDLGFNTGLRLTYDGSHGVNLGVQTNASQVPANRDGFAIATKANPFPLFAHITRYINGGRSNYNAFTAAFNKRMSRGLQFNSSYSFAKNLSNGSGYNPTGFTGEAGGMVTDRFNFDLDYGNVAFTRRHRFLTTFLYELPFGRGGMFLNKSNALVNGVVGGWQLAGVVIAQSGPFLTVVAPGADPAGNNFPNLEGAGRADIVPGAALYTANCSVASWISPGAFAIPANNIGRAGNSSVGSVLGPGTQALSLSLFKLIKISERVGMQFGISASNALNHPNYATPNLQLGTAPFGTITNVQSQEGNGARSVQLTGRISF